MKRVKKAKATAATKKAKTRGPARARQPLTQQRLDAAVKQLIMFADARTRTKNGEFGRRQLEKRLAAVCEIIEAEEAELRGAKAMKKVHLVAQYYGLAGEMAALFKRDKRGGFKSDEAYRAAIVEVLEQYQVKPTAANIEALACFGGARAASQPRGDAPLEDAMRRAGSFATKFRSDFLALVSLDHHHSRAKELLEPYFLMRRDAAFFERLLTNVLGLQNKAANGLSAAASIALGRFRPEAAAPLLFSEALVSATPEAAKAFNAAVMRMFGETSDASEGVSDAVADDGGDDDQKIYRAAVAYAKLEKWFIENAFRPAKGWAESYGAARLLEIFTSDTFGALLRMPAVPKNDHQKAATPSLVA